MNNTQKLSIYFQIIGDEFKKEAICNLKTECSIRDMKISEFLTNGKKTMSQISDKLNLTPGSTTTAIDSLIEKKIVKREFDENDRRKVFISLTVKGKEIAKEIVKSHMIISEKILKQLNNKEQILFLELLDKICSNLNKK